MNAYKISIGIRDYENYLVICDNTSQVEAIWEKKYPNNNIKCIELISEHVLIKS